MWKPQVFESKSQKLDFTSSAQGVVDVTAIYCDGQKLANAIEFMECDENPIHFLFVRNVAILNVQQAIGCL